MIWPRHTGLNIAYVCLTGLLIFLSGRSQATVFQSGDRVHITPLHRINDDLIAAANSVAVSGVIEGDLVSASYGIDIQGEIAGSVDVFAYQLDHSGMIGRSLRAFVYSGKVNGYVGGALVLLSVEPYLGRNATIERNADIFGERVTIDGTIRGDAKVEGEKVWITGTINGDLTVCGKEITIKPPAVIGGNLVYSSATEAGLNIESGVDIVGETIWKPRQVDGDERGDAESSGAEGLTTLTVAVSKILAAFLFGIIMVALCRRYATETFEQLHRRFAVAVATGLITVFAVVLAFLVLVMSLASTIVGLIMVDSELALLGTFVLAGSILMVPISTFATVSGGLVLYTGILVLASFFGYGVVRIVKSKPAPLGRFQLLLGLVILTLLFWIPYVGTIILILVSVTGAGAIMMGIHRCRQVHKIDNALPPSDTMTSDTVT